MRTRGTALIAGSVLLGGLCGCDPWQSFLLPNPRSCSENPGLCQAGQVCNPQTRLCEEPGGPDGGIGGPALSLFAGALGGRGSVDGMGAAARFDYPHRMALDGMGNLFVCDNATTIRKVVVATGLVTTLASTACSGVAVDGAGNLFVSEVKSDTIRKVVVATGAVTTLAGGIQGSADGMGPAARFYDPAGMALDTMGNLFVADRNNHTIRKVIVATGAVTTLAGTAGMYGSTDGIGAAARFNSPTYVAVDGAGNLFVADFNNSTIRKVVVATGAVTTLAGSAGMPGSTDGTGTAARFNRPNGVAMDDAGNLYVGDYSTIRKVVVATGTVITLAGSTLGSDDGTGATARFRGANDVAVDGAGNLFVADTENHTIRKVVVTTGVVTTLAGSAGIQGSTDDTGAAARFNHPTGVAMDGAGNLFVTDYANHTIRKVMDTSVVTTLAGTARVQGSTDGTGPAARFNVPSDATLDGAGNLFVADFYNHTIRKVIVATGAVTTLAGTAGMKGSTDGTGAAARFYDPNGVAVDGAGNLFVADTNNHTIRKVVVATGVVTTLAGTAGMPGRTDATGAAARFYYPSGVAVDGAGSLFVADTYNYTIRKVVVATGTVNTLVGTAGIVGSTDGTGTAVRFGRIFGMGLDGVGNLYVADHDNGTVRKIQLATGSVTTVVGVAGQQSVEPGPLPARLSFPVDVAALPTGELFITDDNAVLRVH